VTAKGGRIEEPFFDAAIARPYLALAALNVGALVAAAWRVWSGAGETDALAINVAWAVHNLVVVSATLAVACERRQLRRSPRVPARLAAVVTVPQEGALRCSTIDLSRGGARLELPWRACGLRPREPVSVSLFAPGDTGAPRALPAVVVEDEGRAVRIRFGALDLAEEAELVRVLFSRPDAWDGARAGLRRDRPLATLASIGRHGVAGVGRMLWLSARAAVGGPGRAPVPARSRP
jgi:cellulose synthase (UDP-forming)